jgi:phosphoenolpyruvate-protein kinase (PTS system EI component)
MGVPITFLGKYNPEQFEIVWTTDRGGDKMIEYLKLPHTRYDAPVVKGKRLYSRILIKRK